MNKIVYPLKRGTQGPQVADLHAALKACLDHGLLRTGTRNVPKSLLTSLARELAPQIYGDATTKAVSLFQKAQHLDATGSVDERTAAALNTLLERWELPGKSPTGKSPNTLRGQVIFDYALPAAGVTLRLYNIGFGGKDTRLGEVKSDTQGQYSFSYSQPDAGAATSQALNLQVRAVDPQGKEIPISKTQFSASPADTLNLVVPAAVQPLTPEFQRLSADLNKAIGGVAKLGQAQEDAERQDLTLLNRSTGWDARLIALAATAAQQTTSTGLGQDVLYALYRVGLPTDPSALAAVPAAAVQQALSKATQAGIVNYNVEQITAATNAFQQYSTKTLLASTSPGMVSSYATMLAPNFKDDSAQQAAFANLYFSQPAADASLWTQAAQLGIPAQTISTLKLQGKFLYLTFNNAPLAAKLQQDIGANGDPDNLPDHDYHQPNAWQTALTTLAGAGNNQALDALIPSIYTGDTIADRLAAYSGDLARKVRLSFPTRTVARMLDNGNIAMDPKVRPNVTNFLRTASALGYQLGRTPLNTFLANSSKNLPALDVASTQSLKTLHRLYQITPSTESLQAAMQLGFTSAFQIASQSKADFMAKYGAAFPPGEAQLVYGQAQTVAAVTFNFYSIAKQLDTSPPVYALSSSPQDRQDAKNTLIQQFPSMASLFGNLDFCECEECRSVLSPAAYFVDLLDLLGSQSAPNGIGYTPLDVLIGGPPAPSTLSPIHGRRPDLGALPLTCENTNTTMPYIDLVNEILEYFIAHNNSLDTGAAYDTGAATTADLTAEPQHIIPDVYSTTLKQSTYPLNLPFDLWIETVRGFLSYFKTSLTQVLDALRPADDLELYTSVPTVPYYRAQILAESLRISPAEYAIFTATKTATWYTLYGGYANEAAALNDLKNAKTLSQKLGISYQALNNLVQAGFLNPKLYTLIFQFERFGIDMGTAFSFTNQPGSTPLTTQQTTDFQTLLDGITARYKQQNPTSTFDAPTWLKSLLTANYSKTVLVLAEPGSGCDFGATALQYADGSSAQPLDFLKLNLLVRLANKLGCDLDAGFDTIPGASGAGNQMQSWTLDEIDRALQTFFPTNNLPAWEETDSAFSQAFGNSWKTALVYLAHLDDLNTRLAPALGRIALLPLWQKDLPTVGQNPLYAQLFLTPGVLNNDYTFDDPNGDFPTPPSDLTADQQPLSAHTTAIQGALGLSAADLTAVLADAALARLLSANTAATKVALALPSASLITILTNAALAPLPSALATAIEGAIGLSASNLTAILNDAGLATPAACSLDNLSLCYRYGLLAQCLGLSVSDMISLKVMSGLNPFQPLTGNPLSELNDDVLLNQTLAFVKQADVIQNSGFTVADLNYLLRQQFDPLGPYQTDPNSLITLVQTVASGLSQIQAQNSVPANAVNLPETLLDQELSGLFPAAILKALFAQLNNSQTYTVSAASPTALTPADFETAPEMALSYVTTTNTQTLAFTGLLLDWRKAELQALNTNTALNALLGSLLDSVQQAARTALDNSLADVLGVWASCVQYEGVATGITSAQAISDPLGTLTQLDPALSFNYDESNQLQWLGYRGVLTANKLSALTTANSSATLASLLNNVQQQALPAYNQLIGSLLTLWCNAQTYTATQSGVATASQIDPAAFASALAQAQQSGSITGPVPAIQFAYDSGTGTQAVSCNGVLPQTLQAPLAALIPSASALLAGLFGNLHNAAVAAFQFLANGLLAASGPTLAADGGVVSVSLTSPDPFMPPFVGSAAAKQQKFAKAELLQVFLPLLAQKLSRQYVIQTLATNLAADAALIEALIADAALLDNPSDPGKSLLPAFYAVGQAGVSASYYGPANALLASGTAATVDTADASNSVPGAVASHYEGYLQVPTDGPYRFFAELGNAGAQVTFNVDAPELAALFANPVLNATATADDDEASQFLQLQGGVAYHFRVDFSSIGANGASLRIQSENLPKGPLNQIILYPLQAITAFTRAKVLLSKALQILAGTGLDLRELSYLAANAAQFNNLDLSSLPTQASDDSIVNSQALFAQFRTLADYTDLRKGPAGGTDGLIDVFQAASQTTPPTPATTVLADLTRRDPQLVQDLATALWPGLSASAQLVNNVGIRRMWDAMQLIAVLGLPVLTVANSTAIVGTIGTTPPEAIAANFKNAVKAQYTPGQWRSIAQSVFDPLRQKKRDALVAYLVNTLGFTSSNQLFEYLLVDPGMEPVVQTSRLRLALSSVQTFIQRCFLNLEDGNTDLNLNVSASAIPAAWWPWMKRYRVWQANREIFLFPENWMEPELRLDKTDLFQTLESALLQGDVTSDLVEDAFLDYLKGLDLRARLDIVATYLDQDPAIPAGGTLHVLGRTYGHPHKYFYRTYASGAWSGWQALTLDLEGDHIVLAVWRGRLNVLWLTFLITPVQPTPPPTGGASVTSMGIGDLENTVMSASPQTQVQIQLHWSEFVQGKWTNPIATDMNKAAPISVNDPFDVGQLHPHVSKEIDSNGNEGALLVHVDFTSPAIQAERASGFMQPFTTDMGTAFRITSKNCDPDLNSMYWVTATLPPYDQNGVDATFYTGSLQLSVSFQNNLQADGSGIAESENILDSTQNFEILACSNPVAPPFPPTQDPLQLSNAAEYADAGNLVSPFFFKDTSYMTGTLPSFLDERTFFVQPSLTETVITKWYGWAIPIYSSSNLWTNPGALQSVPVHAQVPTPFVPPTPGDPVYSQYPMAIQTDWATNPAVTLKYGGAAVSQSGGIRTQVAGGAVNMPVEMASAAASTLVANAGTSRLLVSNQGITTAQLRSLTATASAAAAIPAASQKI